MPAAEPDEPELPLWPEPGTGHGGPAAPSPASRAGEGVASPTRGPPAVHDRPGPAPGRSRPGPGRRGGTTGRAGGSTTVASFTPRATVSGSPGRRPPACPTLPAPAGETRSRLLTTRFLAEGLRRLESGTAPEREGGT